MSQKQEKGRSPLKKRPDLATVLESLRNGERDDSVGSVVYYGLSGLSAVEVDQLKPIWDGLRPEYRSKLMRNLVDVGEANFELDYRALGMAGLDDDSPEVRAAAIEVLWEDESLELMERLIDIALWDEAVSVRAGAASALGRFILLGELGDLPESETTRAQDAVISLLNNDDEDVEVRRRALEAIANCSHEIVPDAIEEAYQSYDQRMRVSAVFAMGRTCDDERWADTVLREVVSGDPAMRYEAARSCGELEIAEAIPYLARLSQERDREIKEVAIWSMGEIGGKEALRILGQLAEEAEITGDQDLSDAIQDAIGNAALVGAGLNFDLDD